MPVPEARVSMGGLLLPFIALRARSRRRAAMSLRSNNSLGGVMAAQSHCRKADVATVRNRSGSLMAAAIA
jgi:hypothetical protein